MYIKYSLSTRVLWHRFFLTHKTQSSAVRNPILYQSGVKALLSQRRSFWLATSRKSVYNRNRYNLTPIPLYVNMEGGLCFVPLPCGRGRG